ncbi:MAG: HNH endonuclease [Nitrospirota bacterium]|nr:HNH endonuclease [Nitrospirota bacterium]
MSTVIECIYCREKQPVSAYTKAEHVIPQSFGKFRNNFTLRQLVCDACNQFFGDNIELALARDTLEGQSRADIGVKKAEDFKSLGHQSRIRIMIAEGDFKGAYAFRDYSEADGKVTLQPVPQVGFRQRESGGYKYFPLDELPDKKQLAELDLDLQHPKSIRAVGLDVEELSGKLAEKNISFRYDCDVVSTNESTSLLCEVQGTIDQIIHRATAKIAFNYLAYWVGGDFIRHSSFDQTRRFVRHGQLAPYPLVKVGQQPILADEEVRRRVGHLVTINWAADGVSIVAQVSLLNVFTYSVCLARNYDGERRGITRGHFFNVADGAILELGTN